MSAATPVQQPAPLPPPVIVQRSMCDKIIQAIEGIAIRVLVPLAAALGIYFIFPFSIALVLAPIAALATAVAMSYFSKATTPEPVLALPATAPVGLRNSNGANCWLNSLIQMIRIDRGMSEWFSNVPSQLDIHVTYFRYFTQELLENLPPAGALPPEAYGDLAADDERRENVDAYADHIRNMEADNRENLFSYLRFLRPMVPTEAEPERTALRVANALLEFKAFMMAYDAGQRERPGQALQAPAKGMQVQEPALYDSHTLRMAIGAVCPRINMTQQMEHNPNTQQDPTEAITSIFTYILPDRLKVQKQERRHYALPVNANGELQPLQGGNVINGRIAVKDETPQVASCAAQIAGSAPNAQDLFVRAFNETNSDPDNRVVQMIDGIRYEFPLVQTESQYLTAPPSFWLSVKRFHYINSDPWVGLHRMAPELFDARPARSVKLDDSVHFQDEIEIQPVNGALERYALDGFIHHSGVCGGGHYISVKRGVDDQGNPAWFKMDDSRVTRISENKARQILEKAYVVHYSKIEAQV